MAGATYLAGHCGRVVEAPRSLRPIPPARLAPRGRTGAHGGTNAHRTTRLGYATQTAG